jgi:hypothetical protein
MSKKTITYNLDNLPKADPERMQRLKELPDSLIDYSDIPALSDEELKGFTNE